MPYLHMGIRTPACKEAVREGARLYVEEGKVQRLHPRDLDGLVNFGHRPNDLMSKLGKYAFNKLRDEKVVFDQKNAQPGRAAINLVVAVRRRRDRHSGIPMSGLRVLILLHRAQSS